jgi:hypothetical protein
VYSYITNQLCAQQFLSADGVEPEWIAATSDAQLLQVAVRAAGVKQNFASIPPNGTVTVNDTDGSDELKLSFIISAPFQHDQQAKSIAVAHGSTVVVEYFVPDPSVPSVCYGLKVGSNPPINLGEAVLGTTVAG